jgi:ectoine hydroxylase-related dioxygenase (phytanoyl-CoA dioxygenase family)
VQHGFTVLRGVLSSGDVADAKEALQLAEAAGGVQELQDGAAQQLRVPDLLRRHPLFAELLLHPAVLSVVQRLLHNDFRCATWSSNTLLPNMSSAVLGWHVDYPYHDIVPPWPPHTLSLQVLWLLDDFTERNGATMFWPHSHTWLQPPEYSFAAPPEAQLLLAPAGSVLIAHGAWWHRQTANASPQPRSALLANFCRAYVVPKADMEGQLLHMRDSGSMEQLHAFQQERLQLLLLGQHRRGLRDVHA